MNETAQSTAVASPKKGLHIALWVIQALLGAAFIAAGLMKATASSDDLVKNGMAWAGELPWLVKLIGVSELAGGLGLILPAATRILPVLTPIAASLLGVVMVLAAAFHVVIEGHASGAVPALVLLALTVFVAYGRFKLVPITKR